MKSYLFVAPNLSPIGYLVFFYWFSCLYDYQRFFYFFWMAQLKKNCNETNKSVSRSSVSFFYLLAMVFSSPILFFLFSSLFITANLGAYVIQHQYVNNETCTGAIQGSSVIMCGQCMRTGQVYISIPCSSDSAVFSRCSDSQCCMYSFFYYSNCLFILLSFRFNYYLPCSQLLKWRTHATRMLMVHLQWLPFGLFWTTSNDDVFRCELHYYPIHVVWLSSSSSFSIFQSILSYHHNIVLKGYLQHSRTG